MTRRVLALALGAFAQLTRGQNASASSATSPAVWYIPLVGLSNATTSSLGANVTQNGTSSPAQFPVVISNGSQSSSSSAALVDASSVGASSGQLLVDSSNNLVLGPNSSLGLSQSKDTVPTVPFGLNLGRDEVWNGSVMFGGSYDENRIYGQTGWASVPAASNGKGTFLSSGKQAVGSVAIRLFHYDASGALPAGSAGWPFGTSMDGGVVKQVPALLDFTSDSLILPNPKWCGMNISLEFNVDVTNTSSGYYGTFSIPILDQLTSSSARCSADDSIGANSSAPAMTLGKPFFQSTYIYVDTHGDLYFSAVNRWDFPIKAVPFDATALLNPPTPPASATQTSPTPTASKSAAGGKSVADGSVAGIARLISILLGAALLF